MTIQPDETDDPWPDALRWRGFSELFDGYSGIEIWRLKKGGKFQCHGDDTIELGEGTNLDKMMDKIIKEDLEDKEGD